MVTQRDQSKTEMVDHNPEESGSQANGGNQTAQRFNQPVSPSLCELLRPVICGSSIRLSEAARNYELKKVHIKVLPSFHGLSTEDPLTFIREFYCKIQTFPLNGVQEEELRMKYFVYCMKDEALDWLINLPEGSLGTWKEMYDKFMDEYYPLQRMVELCKKICTFSQMEEEPFYEAWNRFKRLLNQCPHNQFSSSSLVQFFFDGLEATSQTLVAISAGGNINNKTENEVYEIYEKLAACSRSNTDGGRRAGVHEISAQTEEVPKQLADYW